MARAGTNIVILLMMALATCLFSSAVAATPGKWFDRIYIIVFDKLTFEEAYGNTHFRNWAWKGRLLVNYKSVGNGSQSNYISMIAGRTPMNDEISRNLTGATLIDRLQPLYSEEPPISWKAYLEDYTGHCNNDNEIGSENSCGRLHVPGISYVRAHNPFISFNGIRLRPQRCKNIVPASQLATDASQNSVSDFNFYVPNQCHNGQGILGALRAGEKLNDLLTIIKDHAGSSRTLVVVTFASSRTPQPDRVFTALIPLGQMHTFAEKRRDDTEFDHFSLLRTVEENWGLSHLAGGDASAKNFFYKKNSASMHAPSFVLE